MVEKPYICGGVWEWSFTGQEGQLCCVSAAMWPTDRVPFFKKAGREVGVLVSILAQSGKPSPRLYGGYIVPPDRTFAMITFRGNAEPFWQRVKELETLNP